MIKVNRAPVLTLWVATVAEALGHDREEALTLGKAVAGLNAQSKGRSLGIFKPAEGGQRPRSGLGEDGWVEMCGRNVPVKHTGEGLRAVVKSLPVDPVAVEAYLAKAFGDELPRAREAMQALAGSFETRDLAARAYDLYVAFRPDIPKGRRGWGAKGDLDLDRVRSLGR